MLYLRSLAAMVWSSGVRPVCMSTTKRITEAASRAKSTWSSVALLISAEDISVGFMPMPPVSMRMKLSSTSSMLTSRVTPGWSWTIAKRLPIRRLNNRLFPTLGRPTMATLRVGSIIDIVFTIKYLQKLIRRS